MIYFTSDFHLGTDGVVSSFEREKRIVQWLNSIQKDAEELYLVGDVFDYWFEYGSVIPKGFTRLLGKLAELTDSGVKVFFFTGNHDMWMFNYLTEEMGIPIYREPLIKEIKGKKFYIGHGDGLGPGDEGYKILKKILENKLCQWAYARLHPNFGLNLMKFCSKKSREGEEGAVFLGKEKEWLISFVEEHAQKSEIDYYIFGHRHLLMEYHLVNGRAIYYNLGDWLKYQSYLVFDGQQAKLKTYQTAYEPIII
jgi:UDP-2,3-diacylglucosamine hydrolase